MLMKSGEVKCLLFMRPAAASPMPPCHCAGWPYKDSAIHHSWRQPGGMALLARTGHAVQCHTEKRETIP